VWKRKGKQKAKRGRAVASGTERQRESIRIRMMSTHKQSPIKYHRESFRMYSPIVGTFASLRSDCRRRDGGILCGRADGASAFTPILNLDAGILRDGLALDDGLRLGSTARLQQDRNQNHQGCTARHTYCEADNERDVGVVVSNVLSDMNVCDMENRRRQHGDLDICGPSTR